MTNLTYENKDGLTKPTDFELTTEQELFTELVDELDNELQYQSGDTFYDKPDEYVEVECSNEIEYSDTIINAVDELFRSIGWGRVDHHYEPAKEADPNDNDSVDEDAYHIFKFYFENNIIQI